MNYIMPDFTPGTPTETQKLIAALKATGERLDAAVNSTYTADKERYERKIEEAKDGQS